MATVTATETVPRTATAVTLATMETVTVESQHVQKTHKPHSAKMKRKRKLDDDEECFECAGGGWVSPNHAYEPEEDRRENE